MIHFSLCRNYIGVWFWPKNGPKEILCTDSVFFYSGVIKKLLREGGIHHLCAFEQGSPFQIAASKNWSNSYST